MKQSALLEETPELQKGVPYHSLVKTKEFQELVKRKRSFIVSTTVFFLIFYFTLPILAAYTKVLHTEVIGTITGAWLFAFLQFLVVWICGFVYVKKSEKYDNLAKAILRKYRKELSE